ncbi:MAG TPA: hypothetical protein VHK24_04990, partial [Steroidobacter sp.]|nr:hypothetical protein [Steroidobacter sp.]
FAPANDVVALRRQLERLIAKPALRRRLSEAAIARARRRSPYVMGRRYLHLYRALIERGRTRERAVA